MTQRILVVDDDRQIVRLVQSYLEQAGYTVLAAYDGTAALRLIRAERPDLVVLDLMLPDMDGWAITRAVRADPATAALPILMLTARVEDADRIVGLELGADDYVTKPFNPREVLARVRAILRRVNRIAPEHQSLTYGTLRLDADQHVVTLDGQPIDLTPTEFDLLRLFLTQPGHAFSRQALIEHGLGYAYEGLERTVDSHIKNLRKKLERDPTAPQIETVYGIGYRLHTPGG
jgi:two-component system alkaline phosphatase synthesis response regulator PhoP